MAEKSITNKVGYEFTYNIIPPIIITVIGAASNILLLVAFIKDPLKCFRNSGTYLVLNLSVSDCLVCLFASFYSLTATEILKASSKTIGFLEYWFASVSFLSITSISIDRFLIVGYPIKHRIWMKGKLIILWLAAIWIGSCLVSVLSLICFHTNGINIAYTFCVVLVILSAVMYAFTYYTLKERSNNIALQNSTEDRTQEIRILKEKRFLKTIILIACVAFSCAIPYMILYLSYDSLNLQKDKLISEVIFTASLFIFYINHAVNPFIYILRLPNYRKTFYLLYWKKGTVSS